MISDCFHWWYTPTDPAPRAALGWISLHIMNHCNYYCYCYYCCRHRYHHHHHHYHCCYNYNHYYHYHMTMIVRHEPSMPKTNYGPYIYHPISELNYGTILSLILITNCLQGYAQVEKVSWILEMTSIIPIEMMCNLYWLINVFLLKGIYIYIFFKHVLLWRFTCCNSILFLYINFLHRVFLPFIVIYWPFKLNMSGIKRNLIKFDPYTSTLFWNACKVHQPHANMYHLQN